MSNKYFIKQLYGTRIRGVVTAIENFLNINKPLLDYFSTLSIDSAQDKNLETIGRLMGFVRPIVNTQDFAETLFRFTETYGDDSLAGFAVTYSTSGGGLYDFLEPQYAYLNIEEYRKVLKAIAEIGYSKSIQMLDRIAAIYDTSYLIEWDSHGDITITLNTAGVYKAATCQYVLDKIYTSAPQIIVRRAI